MSASWILQTSLAAIQGSLQVFDLTRNTLTRLPDNLEALTSLRYCPRWLQLACLAGLQAFVPSD